MGLSFGYPLGFLALLGIPAVIAIHFLQRRSRQVTVSTLFLLRQLQRESEGGNRFERLRPSIPLWLQLLAVLILTWLLAEPRWMEKNSVQQIAVVLDGSASMKVSRARLEKQLPAALAKLSSATAHTELYLLDSRKDSGHLYHGDSTDGLMTAFAKWEPSGGSRDPAPSLRLARALAGREGTVIYVTDQEVKELPSAARLLAAGEAADNTGIAGISVDEAGGRTVWRAVLKNHGTAPQTREWWTESPDMEPGPRHSVTLPPGGTLDLQAPFAEGQTTLTLRLSPDTFPDDDTAPILRPMPVRLVVHLPPAEMALPREQQLYTPLFGSLPEITLTADQAAMDVMVAEYNPLDPEVPARPSCLFVRDPRPDAPVLAGTLVVEPHPLTDNLNWHGLLVEDALGIPAQAGDEVLVSQGDRPLLFLRGPADRRLLCFNFDLRKSNARKLPAFVIALHRFLEDVRSRTVREEWRNAECGQRLRCPVDVSAGAAEVTLTWQPSDGKSGDSVTVPPSQAGLLAAPDVPALVEIKQGERLLLKAAAHFADVREADFTAATSRQDLDGTQAALVERHSRADGAWRLWILILLTVLVAAWYFTGRPVARRQRAPVYE